MAGDRDLPPIQTVKVVGTQTHEFWAELQDVMSEAERDGWSIRVLVEGEEARASLEDYRATHPAAPMKEPARRGLWSRLFG